jgi:hypothetical protein
MASDTNLNMIISQGSAVKEVYNSKKQNLELQQQFNTQHTEMEKTSKKAKTNKSSNTHLVNERNKRQKSKNGEQDNHREKEKRSEDRHVNPEGNLIDIKV